MNFQKFKLIFNQNLYINFFSFFVYLLPVCLIIGPAPADIFISILAIYAIFITIYFKRWDLHFTKLSLIIILFNFTILISSLISISPDLSLHSSIFYLRFYLFSIAIYYLANENKYFLKFFFIFFSITLFIIIFDSFFQLYFKVNTTGNIMINNRLVSFFGSELILGSFLARLTPIFFSLLFIFYSERKYFYQINLFFLLVFFIIILMTGERVSIFINIFFNFFYLIFLYANKFKKVLTPILILIFTFVILIYSNDSLKSRILNFSYNQVFLSSNKDYIFTNSPIMQWRDFYFNNISKNTSIDNLNHKKVLEICNKIETKCTITDKDLITLHNLLHNFYIHKFEISSIVNNNEINIREIYNQYIAYRINIYNKIKYHSHSGFEKKLLSDDDVDFNKNDEKQPFLNIQNLSVSSGMLQVDMQHFYNSDFFDNIFYIKKNEPLVFFSPEHDSMLRTAINIFKDNILFGSGPRMYRYLCLLPKYAYNNFTVGYKSCSTSPHNIYVQILSETGIFGFSLILILFLSTIYLLCLFFYKRINNLQISIYHFNLILILFLNLFPFIPTGNFFGNWLSIIFYLPLGLLMYKKENIKKFKYE